MTQPIDTAGLAGHIDIVEQCRDYLNHQTMDEGDPTGKLQDFAQSIRVVVDALDAVCRDRDSYAHSDFERQLDEARAEVERLRAANDRLVERNVEVIDERIDATAAKDGYESALLRMRDERDQALATAAQLKAERDAAREACREVVRRGNAVHDQLHESKVLVGHGVHEFLHYCIGASMDGWNSGPRANLLAATLTPPGDKERP